MAKKKESATDKLANAQAASLAAQVANWAAQLEFQKERMRLLEMPQLAHLTQMDIDKLAFEKSEAEWKRAIQEATVTGTYNGQPTLQWLEQQARMTGVINGQQTLEGKLTDAQIAQMNHAMELQTKQLLLENEKFGFERERWGAEFGYQQQKDLRDFGLAEAGVTGRYNGQDTLEKQRLDSQNAQAYLSLLSNLQGPGNAFKQLRVLGNTPNGLQDLVRAWTGQYQMGGLTGSGQAPGQAQVSDLFTNYGTTGVPQGQGLAQKPPPQLGPYDPNMNNIQGGVDLGGAGMPRIVQKNPDGTVTLSDGSVVQPSQLPGSSGYTNQEMMNYAQVVRPEAGAAGAEAPAGEAGYTVSPPGTQAPIGAYNYEGTPSGQTQVYPPGVAAPADGYQVSTQTPQSMNSGLLPSQINAENYANTNKYGQELMWAYLEDQGWDKMAAQDAFAKSLPKYGGPQQGRVSAGLGF